jgi:hypothetical protein
MTASLFGPVTFARIFIWCVIGWTGIFLWTFVPFAFLYQARTESREVATARIENYRVDETPRIHFGNRINTPRTFATITFERKNDDQCRLENYQLQDGYISRSRPSSVQIALNPHSCYEFVVLPLPRIRPTLLGFMPPVY